MDGMKQSEKAGLSYGSWHGLPARENTAKMAVPQSRAAFNQSLFR